MPPHWRKEIKEELGRRFSGYDINCVVDEKALAELDRAVKAAARNATEPQK